MKINKSDIIWNYIATFLKVGAAGIILPFVLNKLDSETVGIWTVFMTITTLSGLLDLGFNPSFTRNVTYVFSGVKDIKVNGFELQNVTDDTNIDYGLLKGLIKSMKWIYLRFAILLFILLSTVGTFYIYKLTGNFTGNKMSVFVSWFILVFINSYSLFTSYYDSLLQGRGFIKRAKQIIVISQLVYLAFTIVLILFDLDLIAIVSAQAISVVVTRLLSRKAFFTNDLAVQLDNCQPKESRDLLQKIFPNALKIGLTSLGGFVVQKSSIFIGSVYLSLTQLASYGISAQIVSIIMMTSMIYLSTFQPQIVALRVQDNVKLIRAIYFKGSLVLLGTYLIAGLGLLFLGSYFLSLIHSKTVLLPNVLLFSVLIFSYLECNHTMAASILLTKNEVPFFKASILSAIATVFFMFCMLKFLKLGIVAMIFAPGIVQLCYQNWKWPLEAFKDLRRV